MAAPKAKPKKRATIDWETLKIEFCLQRDVPKLVTWLRDVKGWPQKKILSGNTTEHTNGWGDDRAKIQQEINAGLIAEMREKEMAVIPKVMELRLKLIAQIENALSGVTIVVGRGDQKRAIVVPPSPEELKRLWEMLRTELNLPQTITRTQEVPDLADPQTEILRRYNLVDDDGKPTDDFLANA